MNLNIYFRIPSCSSSNVKPTNSIEKILIMKKYFTKIYLNVQPNMNSDQEPFEWSWEVPLRVTARESLHILLLVADNTLQNHATFYPSPKFSWKQCLYRHQSIMTYLPISFTKVFTICDAILGCVINACSTVRMNSVGSLSSCSISSIAVAKT